MDLGNFSVSLAVKDIAASRRFYEAFGFKYVMGDEAQNWLILRNDNAIIGLFHGMFEHNTMTFNPLDVRTVQRTLKERGIPFQTEADETTTGPAHAILFDPDNNPIFLDQHE